MTQEDKTLLLKELSSRLPYGVKIKLIRWYIDEGLYINTTLEPDDIERLLNDEDGDTEIKLYLFPLSSMSEDQRKYITDRWGINEEFDFEINPDWGEYFVELGDIVDFIDWLNENHFDYRGLIEKGLAIDATGLGIY